jgi:SAM-dependent methyltransferase
VDDERRRTEALAVAHEAQLARRDPEGRRSRGAFYTPPALVDWVLDRALGSGGAGQPGRTGQAGRTGTRVLDPACGTGHFLVAAARRLGDVRAVHGTDTDAEAVRIARLRLHAEDPTVPAAEIAQRVRVGDGLTTWAGETFDAVVGNPPFLGQLRRRTAARAGPGHGLGAYTDTSAVFLHRMLDLVRPGGRIALVQPLSLLGVRDAAPVRAAVAERGAVVDFWSSERPVFEGTAVRTCVPVVEVGGAQGEVATWSGPGFEAGPAVRLPHGEWGGLAAPSFAIPSVAIEATGGRVADLGDCTADFRDQYYGLVPHVGEDDGAPHRVRLVTSGLIEPADCTWGRAPTRFAKRPYAAPVVDLAGLHADGALTRWADARLVPKLLVAGQGRVIEAVVDEHGRWLPSVPVVSVVARGRRDLWRLLAVTLAPPVVASAAARFLGTGLSTGSIKLSARQVGELPLPTDPEAWAEGARLAEAAQRADGSGRPELLEQTARRMTAAYDVTGAAADRVVGWWCERALTPARISG